MESKLDSKATFCALVDVLNLAITYGRLEDGDSVLAGLRFMRPRMVELDTFEAWMAIKRGRWSEAIRALRNVEGTSSTTALVKALLAYCQFTTGDSAWRISANQVMESTSSIEAVKLVRLLLDPAAAAEDTEPDEPTATLPALASLGQVDYAFLRA